MPFAFKELIANIFNEKCQKTMTTTIREIDCFPSFVAYQHDSHANTCMIAMDNFYGRLIASQQGSDTVGSSIYLLHNSCVITFPVSRLLKVLITTVISDNNFI